MEIKNGQLIMYDISEEYKKYLQNYDNKVSEKENRKFYGILISKDNIDYYIPFTSKVNKKTNSKLSINIKDKNNNIIAKLLLNNMIPVNEIDSSIVNINESKYKDYYNAEIEYLRNEKVLEEILRKTENIFEVLKDKNNPDYYFFKNLCCNFSLLEEKCKEWINLIINETLPEETNTEDEAEDEDEPEM